MEFHEKLQELRKKKGLTQEELADILFVSRTAVSKWESGRGHPNIESLKAIAKFYSVTIDDLLSGEELLTFAEADHKQKSNHLCDLIFGLLDCSFAMFLFLPLFGQAEDGAVHSVSLLSLTALQPWLRYSFFVVVLSIVLMGILALILRSSNRFPPAHRIIYISLFCNAAGSLLFIMARQPYAAAFSFIFLMIKTLILIKTK